MPNDELDALALLHGTDKASNTHNYTRLYSRYFSDLPDTGALLELGWGGHEDPNAGGASARMWRDWLPGWSINIIENEQKGTRGRKGINLFQGDQADADLIAQIARRTDGFDVVIDDASHLSSLSIASFVAAWPHVRPGGWYVVEDTHQAYHDFWYGEDEASPDPDRPTKSGAQTIMQFLRRLADEVNFRGASEFDLFPQRYSIGYGDLDEIHFHYDIAFLRKVGG